MDFIRKIWVLQLLGLVLLASAIDFGKYNELLVLCIKYNELLVLCDCSVLLFVLAMYFIMLEAWTVFFY